MTDLIIKGAKGIKDGLYVIKDGEMFKYKPNRGTVYTVRSYHIMDRPIGEWIDEHENGHGFWFGTCNQCGKERHVDNYCGNCGAKMNIEWE